MSASAIRIPPGLTTEGLLGRRYMAPFIDSILVVLPILAVFFLGGLARASGTSGILLRICVALILWIGYGADFESSALQATLGKPIMGLRVYDALGGRLKPLRAASRNAIKEGLLSSSRFCPRATFSP
jgi:uncharacterized RDD family membrane protein YckC